jgi:hypothetical protein
MSIRQGSRTLKPHAATSASSAPPRSLTRTLWDSRSSLRTSLLSYPSILVRYRGGAESAENADVASELCVRCAASRRDLRVSAFINQNATLRDSRSSLRTSLLSYPSILVRYRGGAESAENADLALELCVRCAASRRDLRVLRASAFINQNAMLCDSRSSLRTSLLSYPSILVRYRGGAESAESADVASPVCAH